MAKNCSKMAFHRTGAGAVVIEMECGQNGATTKMRMVATGDFNNAYSLASEATLTIPGQPTQTVKGTDNYKYVGACPAGETGE